VGALTDVGFAGWTSVEILPKPDPDSAARQAIRHLRNFIPKER
jgi:sugar phosphate isomerase/epimerase